MDTLYWNADGHGVGEEQVLLHNLSLLGFLALVPKTYNVELERPLFRKPNPKLLEALLHYSYCVIEGKHQANKDFKGFWPVHDNKQRKDFHQRVGDWLRTIKSRHNLELWSTTTSSVLRSAVGSRLVACLVELTTLALRLELLKYSPDGVFTADLDTGLTKDTVLFSLVGEAVLVSVKAQNRLLAKRFAQHAADVASWQDSYHACATQLKDQYYSLNAELLKSKAELQQGESDTLQNVSLVDNSVAKAQDLWATLEDDLPHLSQLQSLIAPIVEASQHPNAIDGHKLLQCVLAAEQDSLVTAPQLLPTTSGSRAMTGVGEFNILSSVEKWVLLLEQLGKEVQDVGKSGQPWTMHETIESNCVALAHAARSSKHRVAKLADLSNTLAKLTEELEEQLRTLKSNEVY